jgi:hypothetical protein
VDLARAFFTGAEKVFARLHVLPHRDNKLDLGSPTARWYDVFVGHQVKTVDLTATGGVNVGTATGAAAGEVAYSDNLRPSRAGTLYEGYIYVPFTAMVTNAAWDGDSHGNADSGTFDTSAMFAGVPANIKAICLLVEVADVDLGTAIAIGPSNGQWAFIGHTVAINQVHGFCCVIPCDANGDFYCYLSGTFTSVNIVVSGYYI